MTTVVIIFQMLILAACLRSFQRRSNPTKEQPARQLTFTEMNYVEWDEFWKKFRSAVTQKDNSRILGMINFPLLQNGEKIGDIKFLDKWVSQLDGIENVKEPLDVDSFPSQDANDPLVDAIRHTNFDQMDFYFARVNGYYKLVEIITLTMSAETLI